MKMAYKPTPAKWRVIRMTIFAVWPGLPMFLILWHLTDLSFWLCLSGPLLVVGVLDVLIERLRFMSGSNGS